MSDMYKVPVPEDLVEKIEAADAKQRMLKTTMTQYLDSHSMDTDAVAVNSVVFKAFCDQANAAELDFMHLKDEMVHTCFPAKDRPFIRDWTLNYSAKEATIVMAPGHKFSGKVSGPTLV